ncbi:hypothetical protein [Granulicella sp. dw_53]|uniref:hypothetical protein n=1 Tax=Granulicella sp. dw_53 TaxID=2719792 RepID=UPI001BD2D7A6|nr:hypothetical protein [Granulicella sp. dw_53]
MDLSVSLPLITLFLATALITLILLVKATHSKAVWIGSILWILLQSAVASTGFYTKTSALPPRFLLVIAPPLLLVLVLAFLPAGKRLIATMDLKWTVLLHSVRILVEICLYWLFLFKQVPALMTFEGGNLDILAGLTAPIVWWAYSKQFVGKKFLGAWNVICFLSVMNALIRAMLSAPFPFQRIAFNQPTVAILYFPFVLLPAFIVPSVLLCHLVILRKTLVATPQPAL